MTSKKILYPPQEHHKIVVYLRDGSEGLCQMPCENSRATHHFDPFGLNIVQNHVQLKLIGSRNSYADENHVVRLIRLENGSEDQTNRNR